MDNKEMDCFQHVERHHTEGKFDEWTHTALTLEDIVLCFREQMPFLIKIRQLVNHNLYRIQVEK